MDKISKQIIPLVALSGDIKSRQVLKLYFDRDVTSEDRDAILEAIDQYHDRLEGTAIRIIVWNDI